ncbi:MAG: hypothetical protein MH204_01210 [Fimbriimonadaceae bacterium]|nr:hypothetical protein [Fimbriimonadaceae bacterium]
MRKAVIDVGSNSVLLAVGEARDGRWEIVRETSRVTGLGRGTKVSGLLSEDGMTDTLGALALAFQEAKESGADEVLAAATMAARIARNTGDFLDRCSAQATPVQVLSGEDEAEHGFLAVANDPDLAIGDVLTIIDPGGHSTELMTAVRSGDGWKADLKVSRPVGALGLRESFWPEERVSGPDLLRASGSVDEIIGLEYLPHSCGTVVALGATGTNLVSIREGWTDWRPNEVHGSRLDYEEIGRAAGWLAAMTDAERAAVPGLAKGREFTIHGGSLILERFLFATHALECIVSIRGWRHALLNRTWPPA